MKDKLGRLVHKDDKVAIASLMFDGDLHTHPCIKLATVIHVNSKLITVRFDCGGFTDDITNNTNNEFVVISSPNTLTISEDIRSFAHSFGIA